MSAENSQNKKQLALIANYQQTFDSEHGKKVLRHLMRRHGFMTTTYVEGDSHTSAFNEGQRQVIVEIIKKLRMDVRKLEAELLKEPQGESDVII